MDLVTKYFRNNIIGVNIAELIKYAKQLPPDSQSGFWVHHNYFDCVSKLFSLPSSKITKKTRGCFETIRQYDIKHTSQSNWPSCKYCLLQCINKYQNDLLNINKKYV